MPAKRKNAPRSFIDLSRLDREMICDLALKGFSDRRIATSLGVPEGRVSRYRLCVLKISSTYRGTHEETPRGGGGVKPRHAIGESGQPEWARSCEKVACRAFERAQRLGWL